jgi:hypothetical protein
MHNDKTIAARSPLEPRRAAWQTPGLRVLAASTAEINVGGSVPDLEGTS